MAVRPSFRALLVVTATAALLAAAPAVASESLEGRLLVARAWLYDCSGECDPAGYYLMAAAGPVPRFRSVHFVRDPQTLATPIHPSISPDGRWLVSATNDRQIAIQSFDAGRLRAVGRRHTIVLTGLTYGLPVVVWSPDSRRLALAGTILGKNGLWIVRRDGTHLRRIVREDRVEVHADVDADEIPAWSSRGGIAFVGSQPSENHPASIYVVRPDGTGLRRVTSRAGDSGPSWSPDGRRFVYTHGAIDGNGSLRTVDLLSHTDRSLRVAGASGAWSPSGSKIAYLSEDGLTVRVVDADGRRDRKLPIADLGGFLVDLSWRR
jgi:Tol biopolymer transport system component